MMPNSCENHDMVFNGVPYRSISAGLHERGQGSVYFYSGPNCDPGVTKTVFSLPDRSGQNIQLQTQDALYNVACYCYGHHGPCTC